MGSLERYCVLQLTGTVFCWCRLNFHYGGVVELSRCGDKEASVAYVRARDDFIGCGFRSFTCILQQENNHDQELMNPRCSYPRQHYWGEKLPTVLSPHSIH